MNQASAHLNSPAYALVDCNNFYCSAERLFDAKLHKKPVVVLSNNDGNVISRSNEAKQFVPMGAPYFKYQSLLEARKAFVFSSNYELYGDMSSRVMESLQQWTPEVEVYSIDEAFLGLDVPRRGLDFLLMKRSIEFYISLYFSCLSRSIDTRFSSLASFLCIFPSF